MRKSLLGIGPALVILACLVGLWTVAPDLVYAFASGPQDLGQPLDASRLRNNIHATVHGKADLSGSATYRGEERPLVLIVGAPVAVLETPGIKTPPTIDATGRLLRADRMASPLSGNPWEVVASRRNVRPDQLYVLVEGASPGVPWRGLGWSALFLALIAFNIWRFVRLRRPAPKEPEP